MNDSTEINLEGIIPEDSAKMRLDKAIADLFPEYSRGMLQTWIANGQVTVDGLCKRPKDKVHGGEKIIIHATIEPEAKWQPEEIELNILHEDDSLLVINKPVGLVVHPAPGNREGTLLNALLHHNPGLINIPRAGIIHRLDKETSGLLIIAKTLPAHTSLVSQLQERTIHREYEAIVIGVMTAGGTVDAPIGRHPLKRKKMAVVESGKPAITHYRVKERFSSHTRIAVFLETGRTHQIRVHMSYIRYPILGDPLYGGRLKLPKGASDELIEQLRTFKHQALHAKRLELKHPESEETMSFSADLPDDMVRLIGVLRENVI